MGLKTKWRLLAWVTALTYVVMAVGAIWLLLRNLLFAAVLLLTLLVAGLGLWLMATGSGKRAIAGGIVLALGGLLLSAEALYFIRTIESLWPLAVVLLITILYLGLLTLLRRAYWAEARRQGSEGAGVFQRPYLIINPKAGGGRAVKARVADHARRLGVRSLVLEKGQVVETVARQAVDAGADVIGISGGDGSIGAVAKVALERGLPMVVLPGGTRCHFARDIGLSPKRITDALSGFRGVERRIDVATINGRVVLNNVSFGMYADIIDQPGYREHKREAGRQVMRSIVSGAKKPYSLQFHNADEQFTTAVEVLVGVNRYNTVNIFELGQRRRLDEGLLQVTAVTRLDDAMVRRLLRAASLKQLDQAADIPGLYQWTCQEFTVGSTSGQLVVGVDGEREVYDTPVQIQVQPAALRLYVPAEGERGRSLNPFGAAMRRLVWRGAFR